MVQKEPIDTAQKFSPIYLITFLSNVIDALQLDTNSFYDDLVEINECTWTIVNMFLLFEI